MLTLSTRGKEDYFVSFENTDAIDVVKEFYADRENCSIRQNFDTIAIKEEDILTARQMESISVEENAYPANDEAKLWFRVDKKFYPLSVNAIKTNGTRTKLSGEGLMMLEDELLKKIIFDLYGKLQNKDRIINVIIIDNMVRAILSNDYKIVPIKDVVNTLDSYLVQRFKNAQFTGGYCSYDKISLMFNFNTSEEVPLLYGRTATWQSGLKFESSDTGFCSNLVKACWYTENGTVVFDDVAGRVRLIHKGENDLVAFEKSLNSLFVKLHDRAAYIQKQLEKVIQYPLSVIDEICSSEKPIANKSVFKTLLGKKDCKLIKDLWLEKQNLLTEDYKNYISLLDEDEEIPDFKITMYDIIQCFIEYQTKIKPEKREILECFCGVLLITDFSEIF